MLLVWKNKGILVMLYLIISVIGATMVIAMLERNIGGVFSKIDGYSTLGIGLLIAALWTYLTKDDYYKDRNDNKVKMDTVNEFFFIRMQTWAYIFVIAAIILFGYSFFRYFSHLKT